NVVDVLFDGECIGINLRNLPPDWTKERIVDLVSRYGSVRECVLVTQSSESKLQWCKITFMKKSEAKSALNNLSGEVLGSKTIAISTAGSNAPSMFHQISGNITITWSNGPSTGNAVLTFLTAKSANEVLSKKPFPKTIPIAQK